MAAKRVPRPQGSQGVVKAGLSILLGERLSLRESADSFRSDICTTLCNLFTF